MSFDKGRDATPTAGDDAKKPDALAMVARQPIYDAGMAVSAYELLYRESDSALRALVTDSRRATLRVIATAALEIGLDRLARGLPVHINFPRELPPGGDTPLPLAPQSVVIQVFDDLPATRDVIEALRALRARGHKI